MAVGPRPEIRGILRSGIVVVLEFNFLNQKQLGDFPQKREKVGYLRKMPLVEKLIIAAFVIGLATIVLT